MTASFYLIFLFTPLHLILYASHATWAQPLFPLSSHLSPLPHYPASPSPNLGSAATSRTRPATARMICRKPSTMHRAGAILRGSPAFSSWSLHAGWLAGDRLHGPVGRLAGQGDKPQNQETPAIVRGYHDAASSFALSLSPAVHDSDLIPYYPHLVVASFSLPHNHPYCRFQESDISQDYSLHASPISHPINSRQSPSHLESGNFSAASLSGLRRKATADASASGPPSRNTNTTKNTERASSR